MAQTIEKLGRLGVRGPTLGYLVRRTPSYLDSSHKLILTFRR